ncbi:MAG TPA: hypothetical protein PLA87_06940, partial [Pseudomonadota bacterium]|nr:hypothetical protein [Pseudomonadota bacterium]
MSENKNTPATGPGSGLAPGVLMPVGPEGPAPRASEDGGERGERRRRRRGGRSHQEGAEQRPSGEGGAGRPPGPRVGMQEGSAARGEPR